MLANRIATILGIGFVLVGVLGFVVPHAIGMHLSLVHSIVHLVTGAAALWLGLRGSPTQAKVFCIAFGAVYVLLGIAGFVAGGAALPTPGVPGPEDPRLWKLLPGTLELGTIDHVVHVVLGALFLVGGLATKTKRLAMA